MRNVPELRADRGHAMNAWRAGGDGSRWPGDDGRELTETDLLRMRLNALEGTATPLQQTIVAAERAQFDERDAVFEAGKAELAGRAP